MLKRLYNKIANKFRAKKTVFMRDADGCCMEHEIPRDRPGYPARIMRVNFATREVCFFVLCDKRRDGKLLYTAQKQVHQVRS